MERSANDIKGEVNPNDVKGEVGLVLAGGGARGAYELGALQELLPELDPADRPRIIVGTSAGAINAAYLAAMADRDLEEALNDGCKLWRNMMEWHRVLKPLVSWAELKLALSTVGDALRVPWVHSRSIFDPTPLRATLGEIPVGKIAGNVAAGELTAVGMVATRAATSLSLVFYATNGTTPQYDEDRGIGYESVDQFSVDHVLASAAIPSAFPAVPVRSPGAAEPLWYFDGGTRLNTPIKPALDLGAKRLIIVALNCPHLGLGGGGTTERPTVIDGGTQLIQALLIDPMVNDIHNLSTINKLVAAAGTNGVITAGDTTYEQVPFMLIAPELPNRIGELAKKCYHSRYRGLKSLLRRYHSVARLARLLDVEDAVRGELLSYLFFDQEFAEELLRLGREDARTWLNRTGAAGPWRFEPLPPP